MRDKRKLISIFYYIINILIKNSLLFIFMKEILDAIAKTNDITSLKLITGLFADMLPNFCDNCKKGIEQYIKRLQTLTSKN